MSKEKTRAELHAEVADLKAKVAEANNNLQGVIISRDELKEKYDALVSEHESCEKSLNQANSVIEQKNRENACLNKAIKLSGEANDRLIQDRDASDARVEYLEGELKEKTELNESQGERIQKYSERVERIRADRDKAQYIAADLLEHGIFHFLIVKYRNLRAK